MQKEFLWVEKYRPQSIEDTILLPSLKKTFQAIVDSGEVPNMIFSGTAGLGKTTVAEAICKQLDLDYIKINGSEAGRIDTLRNEIKQFASTVSFGGGYKVVIIDEADYSGTAQFQPALRGFIEEFSSNCRFILTANYKQRIIKELHSRCSVYDFNPTTGPQKAALSKQFMDRLLYILKEEDVKYESQIVASLIMKHTPDWRRITNEAQRFGMEGTIDENTVIDPVTNFKELFGLLKGRNYNKIRSWIGKNSDLEASKIFSGLFQEMEEYVEDSTRDSFILILADYQYKSVFVPDQELNLAACFLDVTKHIKFK